MATSASILTTFSGFRLKLTFQFVYKWPNYAFDHANQESCLCDNPYKAEYKGIAGVAQYGEHHLAQTDHTPHKASL